MILPVDTKDPLPSDDEDEYVVPPSPVPVPRGAPQPYTRYDADDPYNTAEDVPFLWSQSPDDIELAPPPYTPIDRHCSPDKAQSITHRIKTALSRAKFILAALYLGIALYLLFGRQRWHRRFGPPPPQAFGGWGRPPPGGWKSDGAAVACASFNAAQWGPVAAAARSSNATFLLPTHAGSELFTHLNGPAAIGPVFVTTFDGDSDAEHAAVAGAVSSGKRLAKGEYVRVTVEAVYDAPGLDDAAPATAATSPGWAMLEAADICLMQRNANTTRMTSSPHDFHNHWFAKPGLGVGIYTDSVNATTTGNGTSPLTFRIHVALPVVRAVAPKPATLLASVLSSLKLSRPVQPRGAIPPLSIRSGESDVFVADLRAASLGGLFVESKLGSVVVEHVRAESVRLSTLGTIVANVTASHMVGVSTPSGKVDLDVSVGRSPAYTFFPTHRHRWGHTKNPAQNGGLEIDEDCALPPLAVDVSVNNANATVRHSGWEVPCRQLSERIRSMVGSVEGKWRRSIMPR